MSSLPLHWIFCRLLNIVNVVSVQNLKNTPVKRHHSTGDMLGGDVDFPSPPRSHRTRRPKSEGNFYVEAFRSKRASSFGVGRNN